MAVKGIGSNYLYPVQNDYKPDSKTEDTKKHPLYIFISLSDIGKHPHKKYHIVLSARHRL